MKVANPLVLGMLMAIGLANAGPIVPFTAKDFEQLTQAGKPVVVDVTATWCPTCKAQKPIIEGLMKQPAFNEVTVLTVDFDKDKQVLKRFKVGSQSTLVAFKGASEVGRSVGDTTPDGIESLVRKTLK